MFALIPWQKTNWVIKVANNTIYILLGFIAIIKGITNFSESLVNLELNFGYNKVTDVGLIEMYKLWREVSWKNLTNLRLGFYRNELNQGIKKLAKVIIELIYFRFCISCLY